MVNKVPPDFPKWLPKPVCKEARELWKLIPAEKDPVKAEAVLQQLISNRTMEDVWIELYRRRGKDGYYNPACLTRASEAAAYRAEAAALRQMSGDARSLAANQEKARQLEFEARLVDLQRVGPDTTDPIREQDYAARLFLRRAYRAGLVEPQRASDSHVIVGKLRAAAEKLRNLAAEVHAIKIGVTERYAERLIDAGEVLVSVAKDCESDATVYLPYGSWPLVRQRGDMRRRAFVILLFMATDDIFAKPLFGTIAKITNVVFRGIKSLDHTNVRQIARGYRRRIRPSLDPLLYKEEIIADIEAHRKAEE